MPVPSHTGETYTPACLTLRSGLDPLNPAHSPDFYEPGQPCPTVCPTTTVGIARSSRTGWERISEASYDRPALSSLFPDTWKQTFQGFSLGSPAQVIPIPVCSWSSLGSLSPESSSSETQAWLPGKVFWSSGEGLPKLRSTSLPDVLDSQGSHTASCYAFLTISCFAWVSVMSL